MSLQFEPLHPLFAARASGLDLSQPLGAETIQAINEAMNLHAVLVWPDQPMNPEQHLRFAAQFGPLDIGLKKVFKRKERLPQEPLVDISNLDTSGQVASREHPKNFSNYANQLWHSDSSFQNPRASYSMLNAVTLPSWGGNTEFVDLRAAWDALPTHLKDEAEGLLGEHYALHSRLLLGDESYTPEQRAAIPAVHWPLVQTHPGSGRKHLFIGSHVRAIQGVPVPEARILLAELLEYATLPQCIFAHAWSPGDLVMWDNRCTLHRGRRFDIREHRELRRTTVLDCAGPQAVAA